MAGLDTVISDETPKEDPAAVAVKPKAAAKSKYNTFTCAGPTLLEDTGEGEESTLAAMQKLIEQKKAQRGSFSEAFKDASAWLVPAAQRTESLAKRGEIREQQAADIFNKQQEIQQFKAQQEAAKRDLAGLNKVLGVTPATGGAAPAPVSSRTNVVIPPETKELIKYHLDNKDIASAKKAYTDWAAASGKKRSEEQFKDLNKLVDIRLNGQTMQKPQWWINDHPELFTDETDNKILGPSTGGSGTVTAENVKTVESGGKPGLVSSKGAEGVMQVMPNTQKDPGFGVTPAKDNSQAELERVGRDYYAAMQKKFGNDTFAAIAYNMGPAATEKWIKAGADFNKLPAETQAYIGKVHLANAKAGMTPTTTEPVAPSVVKKPKVSSAEEVAAAGAGMTAESQKTGEAMAAEGIEVDKKRAAYGTNKVKADKIYALADQNPTMLGVLVKPGVISMIGTGLKEGIKVGPHGQLALPAIEEMTAQMSKGATKESLTARRELAQTLHQVELDLSSLLKGQGTVSDAERRILAGIAGSVSDPADLLKKKATILRMHAEYDKEMGDAYRKSGVPWSQFKKSDAYMNIVDSHANKLMENFKKEYNAGQDLPYDETFGRVVSPKVQNKERKSLIDRWTR